MECQRRWRPFSSAWLLILEVFALRETQAAHHRHVAQFTAVSTVHSLLELNAISFVDDIEIGSYNKVHREIIIKIPWISEALGVKYITQRRNLLVDHEQHFRWAMHYFARNETNPNSPQFGDGLQLILVTDLSLHQFKKSQLQCPFTGNHTGQLLADCETDNGTKVKSHIHLIWDGEEIYRIDEEVGHWETLKPEGQIYQHVLHSPFWTDLRKRYMNLYCVDLMKKIVGYKNVRDNVPPEVTVSRHVNPEGSIILSCTATGFYPHSILLHWEKNGNLGVWGKETSSGTLPNVDATFYLHLTLELPPEDSGMGYTCVVEHSQLKTPAVYPVPEKPTMETWVLALGIVLAVILLLSCAGAFIAWKKKKSDMYV